MYINKPDLLTAILEEELEEIVRNDYNLVYSAIAIAVDEARAYLFDSFDVDAVFAMTGLDRNQMLVSCCVDIAIYVMVSRCQAGMDLTDRKDRYDRAKAWLKMVQRTEIYADLPRREVTEQKHISYNSNPKRGNYF